MIFDNNYDVSVKLLGRKDFNNNIWEILVKQISGATFFGSVDVPINIHIQEQQGYEIWKQNNKQFLIEAEIIPESGLMKCK